MKFTLNWLKAHLDTDADLDTIVATMISVGLEVEDVVDPASAFADFVVGEVLDAKRHPDADRLQVCVVDTGNGTTEVVCGAPNARKGLKGVFAPVGAYIPGSDFTLTKAKIRGVESRGMLCSERELELSDEHDGIIELDPGAKVGSPAAAALGLTDPVIQFEVTPNRPDTLAVRGVARDLAAAGLGTLKPKVTPEIDGAFPCPVPIGLHFDPGTEDACPVFAGRVVRGVKNGPSPDWLQQRLKAIGLRPINALVDITNFISYDRARPLHAYDAAKVTGEIHARLGRKGEKFLALDGKDYDVDADMCVIADDSGVLGLAGIMGGEASGSSERTTDVFIESAYFDPARTARTGRRTGIVSDARYRFERGVDPADVIEGLDAAVVMVLEICGGEASALEVAGASPEPRTVIDFDPAQVERLTGLKPGKDEIVRILSDLGFDVGADGSALSVTAPTWRPDVEGPACLVEEVARIVGFDKLPETPLPRPFAIARPILTERQKRVRLARRTLAMRGMTEAVTWSFVPRVHAELFGGGADALVLANPIAADLDCMRPSALPGLLAAAGRNMARGIADLALFEVGPHYAGDGPTDQKTFATGIRLGARDGAARHWAGATAPADAIDAKADALAVIAACGLATDNLQVAPDAPAWYHPGRSGTLKLGPKNELARFGEVHPRVLDALDITGPAVAFEIDLMALPEARAKATKTKPALDASDLPPVQRDFAFVVAEDVTADALMRAVRSADKALVTNIALFDVFSGKGIPDGHKSLAVAVTLQPHDKTLTEPEIEKVSERIVAAVAKATGGTLRS